MKRILFTGASGFIGRNVIPLLCKENEIFIPRRNELNLLSELEVRDYIKENKIEIVINAANPDYTKSDMDDQINEFENRMRIFLNLYNAKDYYSFMYNIGSGAEYNKFYDIRYVNEKQYGVTIPYDGYGLAKFTMHEIIKSCDKACDLIVFAIYGPTDHESKFITHCVDSCLKDKDITIRQDCFFDYLYVDDFAGILDYFINNIPRYKEYNITTGNRYLLSDIAKTVIDIMKTDNKIVLLSEGMNNEYTADNSRLISEIGEFKFTSLRQGIVNYLQSRGIHSDSL